MEHKTEILCNVHSCKFHSQNRCEAEVISVCCDECMTPNTSHETACKSFVTNISE